MINDALTEKVIGAAIEVHRVLGPGLLESAYATCLLFELRSLGLEVVREKKLPIVYKDIKLDHGYRIDLLVENQLVLELKTVESLNKVHFAQVLTYLKLGGYNRGLLINFNVKLLRQSQEGH